MALRTFCDICSKEIINIVGAGKLIYFEKVSNIKKETMGVENRINKVEADICCECNEQILKIVKKCQ